MRKILMLVFLMALPWPVSAMAPASPVGLWETERGRGHVRIEPCGTALCGTIAWLRKPNDETGRPRTDANNPDPAMRDRPILGLRVLQGFVPDPAQPGRWIGGQIYNPEDGETYRCTMTLEADGALTVRGYVGLPIFGRSQTWRPVL